MPGAFPALVGIVPQPVVTVTLILPAGVVDDGIERDAVKLAAASERDLTFGDDILEPSRSSVAFTSRLRDQQRPSVTLPDLQQHAREGLVAGIALLDGRAIQHELIVRVEVDPQDVQIARVTAELWPDPSAQHVPRLVLQQPVRLDAASRPGLVRRLHDVNQWVRLHEA